MRFLLGTRRSGASGGLGVAALLGFACSVFPDRAVLPGDEPSGRGGSGHGGGAAAGDAGDGLGGHSGLASVGGAAGGTGGTSAGGTSAGETSAGGTSAGAGGGELDAGAPASGGAAGQGGASACPNAVLLRLVASADAYLSELSAEQKSNFGDADRLKAGGTAGARSRALLAFDLSSVPSQPVVVSASLRITIASAAAGALTLSAFRVGRAWDEAKVTWLKSTAPVSWASPGGDTALVASAARSLSDATPGQPVELDLRADLQAQVDAGEPSHGWLVDVGPAEAELEFASRESAFAEERPELSLELCPRD